MADLPYARATLDQTGAGIGTGADYMAILSCTELGTAAAIRTTAKVQDTLDEFGRSEGADLAAHAVDLTKKQYLFGKLATATAGAIGPVDTTSVLGSSVVTFTGTPHDDEHILVEVLEGGTIGTAGIIIRTSRDGGRTWGGNIALGTATSYLIPNTGVTANFAAGDLDADDLAVCYCTAPKWNGTGLAAAFTALKAYPIKPRIIVVCGDCDDSTDVQDIIDEIEAFETDADRHSVVLCSLRDRYAPAEMQGEPSDVDFDATGDTITRNTGSWVTDGFKVGMTISIDGTASNDGDHVVTAVAATVLTVASSPGLATEANVNGNSFTVTGVETKATWRAALQAIMGATPATEKQSEKVVVCGGRARRKSKIYSHRKARPFSWAVACRVMAHAIHVSPAKVSLGALEGWEIHDANGTIEQHDERVDGGLLAMRLTCARTYNEKAGVYCALPLTIDEDGKPLSRLPVVLVGQAACTIAQRAMVEQLGGDVLLNENGTLQEAERRRIQSYANTQLRIGLLSDGPEGRSASSCVLTITGDTDLRVPGAEVSYEVALLTRGYLEKLSGKVRVNSGG